MVELWESDTFFDDHYETSLPDANGGFSWVACHGDGWGGGEPEYYVKVLAKSQVDGKTIARVLSEYDPIGNSPQLVYEFRTDEVNTSGKSTIAFGPMPLDDTKSAAINIVESIHAAWTFWFDAYPGETSYSSILALWTPGRRVRRRLVLRALL